VDWVRADGDRAGRRPSRRVAGPLAAVLTAERTAQLPLPPVRRATATRRLVDVVTAANPRTQVWDTRKTLPGLRAVEKAAVRAGGGANHRGSLSDMVLVKDNRHLAGRRSPRAVALAGGTGRAAPWWSSVTARAGAGRRSRPGDHRHVRQHDAGERSRRRWPSSPAGPHRGVRRDHPGHRTRLRLGGRRPPVDELHHPVRPRLRHRPRLPATEPVRPSDGVVRHRLPRRHGSARKPGIRDLRLSPICPLGPDRSASAGPSVAFRGRSMAPGGRGVHPVFPIRPCSGTPSSGPPTRR
jgi:hypothetical protein